MLLASAAAAGIVLSGERAEAASTYESTYGFDRTWNAALRMVRVDMGCKITEKDDASGYMMFEYHPADGGKKVSNGSMEFIRSHDQETSVRVILQLPQMPRYHEQVLIDALARKMRTEYGDPPPSRPKAPEPPPQQPPRAPAPTGDAGANPEAGESF
jgi:hypothetical protein